MHVSGWLGEKIIYWQFNLLIQSQKHQSQLGTMKFICPEAV